MTRYFQETHPAPFKQGTNEFARFYGMLIDGLQMGYVSGFGYIQVLPAPEAELPQRFERAAEALAQKAWREQLRDWDERHKPASIAIHRELQAVDADTLSDKELVDYLRRCRDHHAPVAATEIVDDVERLHFRRVEHAIDDRVRRRHVPHIEFPRGPACFLIGGERVHRTQSEHHGKTPGSIRANHHDVRRLQLDIRRSRIIGSSELRIG